MELKENKKNDLWQPKKKKKNENFNLLTWILILSLLVVALLCFFSNYPPTPSQNSKSENSEAQNEKNIGKSLEKKEVIVRFAPSIYQLKTTCCFIGGDKEYYIDKKHPTIIKLEQEGKLKEWMKLREENKIPPELILRYYEPTIEAEEEEFSFDFSEENQELELIEQKKGN